MNPEQLLDYLIQNGQAWVLEQRNLHRPEAVSLNQQARSAFGPFFDGKLLDLARFKMVPGIKNPGFYRELEAMGQLIPLDFTTTHGITFQDTVLLSEHHMQSHGSPLGLLFHELVHVAQYQCLGVPEFVRRYVSGWAENGYEYIAIPLERDAYELQNWYEMSPTQPFSVEQQVIGRLELSE